MIQVAKVKKAEGEEVELEVVQRVEDDAPVLLLKRRADLIDYRVYS